jgi:dCMP deaminase
VIEPSHWDLNFLRLAKHVSTWSKDPSTKVGAVLVAPERRWVSLGYNGFPRGTDDCELVLQDRSRKLKRTLHAEENAILNETRSKVGCTLYVWPLSPCAHCAAMLIQVGVVRVVSVEAAESRHLRWKDDFEEAGKLYAEAGVDFVLRPALP